MKKTREDLHRETKLGMLVMAIGSIIASCIIFYVPFEGYYIFMFFFMAAVDVLCIMTYAMEARADTAIDRGEYDALLEDDDNWEDWE